MAGHFERGVWVVEPPQPQTLMYKITVDTTQMRDLEARLTEMRDLFAVPESMTTFWQRVRWLITGKVTYAPAE